MVDQLNTALHNVEIRRVGTKNGAIHVRHFPGNGPAFLLLHGFPDNSRIYDDLIPHLVAGGRQVVAIDFLGFGASEKPADAQYSFAQQIADVEAVAKELNLPTVIPVGHDAGGPAAINFALKHPQQTAAVVVINAFYGDAPGLLVPELIEVFSHKPLKALQQHFLRSPEQFAWLLNFQRERMSADLTEQQKRRYQELLGPVIDENFRQQPSAGPAFAQMTYQLGDEVASNTARLVELRRSHVPFTFVWGRNDPYLHVTVAEYMCSQVRQGVLHVLDAGHWPQIDESSAVANIMLGVR
ncbi:alpha/beta fold hydrolase [Pseudoduganella sp. FT26W]|uniref:Alpha/beta fold hydrolase n=1 Tax=Duganella aquatilis TaxID=2666082 RepID=A0A844DFX5_9BURK|nr:alpha/beta hydrolase [Duganella aquatilis]MRW87520.1 alpha/beta fold hydrolase [Duganella aquatilis]